MRRKPKPIHYIAKRINHYRIQTNKIIVHASTGYMWGSIFSCKDIRMDGAQNMRADGFCCYMDGEFDSWLPLHFNK